MKSVKAKPFIFYATFLSLFLVAVSFTSCLKSEPPTPVAYLNVIHSSAGDEGLNFALDHNRVYYQNFRYGKYTGYFRAFPGTRAFKVYERNNDNPLITNNINLIENKHYSVFIVDTSANMEAVLLRDSTQAAGQDSIRIRFANMSPDVPAMDFYLQGENTPIASNVAYKTAVDFVSKKLTKDMVFEVKKSGQNTVLATSDKYNLWDRRVYTIWSGGYQAGTGDRKLKIFGMIHN
ncbi:MAG TPA: DUF4397 domain-containing protein [Niabella sp.]|jgi:hypothetical protein|nr:DUF4397 domain-containing protein [Chitinophagaceae bacterium]HRN47691.1 DUF4397 domain-containing protein [Niabella sp.]HRO83905.1 DUF4397 domain-containing protein [Niabella sp.]